MIWLRSFDSRFSKCPSSVRDTEQEYLFGNFWAWTTLHELKAQARLPEYDRPRVL